MLAYVFPMRNIVFGKVIYFTFIIELLLFFRKEEAKI